MDRRVEASRSRRRAAARRRAQAAAAAEAGALGDAWAVVVYREGEGFALEGLHETRAAADAARAAANQRIVDECAVLGGPYGGAVAAAVAAPPGAPPCCRGVEYHGALVAERGGHTLLLYPSREEAEAAAAGGRARPVRGGVLLPPRAPAPKGRRGP